MTKIYKNYAEFSARENKLENGVSESFAAENPEFKAENETNEGCWNCSYCSDCRGCRGCRGCSEKNGDKAAFFVPKIENIHSVILAACSNPGALEMGNWHSCETTHCRAGWVVHLAGEAGKKLEAETSTLFAAMQIYHASSPIKVSPPRFFESNEVAMKDIERCAAEESKL